MMNPDHLTPAQLAILRFVERVDQRANGTIERTGKIEGAHNAAIAAELEVLGLQRPVQPPGNVVLIAGRGD